MVQGAVNITAMCMHGYRIVTTLSSATMRNDTMQTTIPVIPKGFSGLIGRLATQRAAQMPQPKVAQRVRLLDGARAAVAEGKLPQMLEFASTTNYSYNRHALELHKLAEAGLLDEVVQYPLAGSNTYAKALMGYRSLLVEALEKAKAAKPASKKPAVKKAAKPKAKPAAKKVAPKKATKTTAKKAA